MLTQLFGLVEVEEISQKRHTHRSPTKEDNTGHFLSHRNYRLVCHLQLTSSHHQRLSVFQGKYFGTKVFTFEGYDKNFWYLHGDLIDAHDEALQTSSYL